MIHKQEKILECIIKITNAEKDYRTASINRSVYLDTVLETKKIYITILKNSQFAEGDFYRIFFLYILEKYALNLKFEDLLCEAITYRIKQFEEKLKILTKDILSSSQSSDSNSSKEVIQEKKETTSNKPKRTTKRSNYPQKVLRMFKLWLSDHISHPYPSEIEKQEFCEITGLDITQINNWFINARRRLIPKNSKKKL